MPMPATQPQPTLSPWADEFFLLMFHDMEPQGVCAVMIRRKKSLSLADTLRGTFFGDLTAKHRTTAVAVPSGFRPSTFEQARVLPNALDIYRARITAREAAEIAATFPVVSLTF